MEIAAVSSSSLEIRGCRKDWFDVIGRREQPKGGHLGEKILRRDRCFAMPRPFTLPIFH
jgi:hypothetical protein